MIKIIINEQHSLLPQQEKIIHETFGAFETEKIPASGLNLREIKVLGRRLRHSKSNVLFISPLPALIKQLNGTKWFVMHNDKREKKELPNGKIIFTPAKNGWEIV